ncbi:MAG: tetratricopeptide repeat protein [Bacteroidales bacterium]|nr:tetratricopeptide repeat protein [Bacteroidales bacterium]
MKQNIHITNILVFVLLIAAMWGMTSCSTSKNTFPNRVYHNVTCKYNVLWNGQQAMKAAETELAKLSKDNYTTILPVYYYPAKSDLGAALPQLDRTIEKSSKAIYKHSMLFKGKQYVKTIDDAYLIMGKSYFYKQDYPQAQRVFTYITHNFPQANTYNEAAVMLARTAMRQNFFASADEQLENLHYLATNKKNKKFNVLFNAAKAEYHLTAPDGDRQEAIDYLNNAIDAHPKREFKARLNLILGQLYEQMNQQAEAQKRFQQVIKKSSNYEMVFSAQMHLASNYDGTPSARNAIMRQFKKMLDEVKNEDFKDQIYYACSEIARVDGNDTLRKNYLAKSVAASTNNYYQRTFSSLTLADLYFEENEYRKAQAYYDTAALSIPKNYPDYDLVIQKSRVLKDLVNKLDEIDLQDSLQRIAKMSDSQRKAWVQKMIANYTEAERKAAAEEAERMLALQNASSYTNINTTSSNGKWYFYNQQLVTSGQQDFYRRWGSRKLEDNWFVSNKQQLSFDDMALMNDPSLATDTTEYDENGNPIPKRETDPKKEAYYLQDLPLTPGAIDSSNAIIAKNLYEAGYIYRDLLHDIPRACASFESLIQRFPKSEYTLPSIYLLYTLYQGVDQSKSDHYKNLILTQYGDTDYAKLINDPHYYERLAEREKTLERQYESLYAQFNNKQWAAVVRAADEAIPQCTDPVLKSKYTYLRTVAAGQVYNEDTLIRGLQYIISEFPTTEVADLARTYLSIFDAQKIAALNQTATADATNPNTALVQEDDKKNNAASTASKAQNQTPTNPFNYNGSEMHYVILLVTTSNIPVQTVKQNLASFNQTYFSLQRFNVNSFYVNNTQQMVTIAKFNDAEQAMNYYNILVKNEMFSSDINNKTIIPYAISAVNYTTFYNNTEGRVFYDDFFKEHYLQN